MDLNENLIRETEQGLINEQNNEKKKGKKKESEGKSSNQDTGKEELT